MGMAYKKCNRSTDFRDMHLGASWPLVAFDAQIIKYDGMFADNCSLISIRIDDIKPTPSANWVFRLCHAVWRARYVFIVMHVTCGMTPLCRLNSS